MKLNVVEVVNGNMKIDSEWVDNVDGAIMRFFERARLLRSDKQSTHSYDIRIVDNNMNQFGNYYDSLDRTEPEPEPEPSEE